MRRRAGTGNAELWRWYVACTLGATTLTLAIGVWWTLRDGRRPAAPRRHPSLDTDALGECISLHSSPVGCEARGEARGGGSSFAATDDIYRVRRFCGRRLNTTSPCYELEGVTRCLPAFFLVGVMKAGTSALAQYLSEHPLVIPPRQKESYFLSRYHEHRPLCAWAASFPQLADGSRALTFDASPNYIFRRTAARFVRELLPEARAIVLLRSPVERAFSQYRFALQLGEHGGASKPECVASRARLRALLGRRSFSSFIDEADARGALHACGIGLDVARSRATGHTVLARAHAGAHRARRAPLAHLLGGADSSVEGGDGRGGGGAQGEQGDGGDPIMRAVFSERERFCVLDQLETSEELAAESGADDPRGARAHLLRIAIESVRLWRDLAREGRAQARPAGAAPRTGCARGGRSEVVPGVPGLGDGESEGVGEEGSADGGCGSAAAKAVTQPALPALARAWAEEWRLLRACTGGTMSVAMVELGHEYARGVGLWFGAIGVQRMLLLRTEDMAADTPSVVGRALSFVGLGGPHTPRSASAGPMPKLCPLDFGVQLGADASSSAQLGPCDARPALPSDGSASEVALSASERARLERLYSPSVGRLRRTVRAWTRADWAPWW